MKYRIAALKWFYFEPYYCRRWWVRVAFSTSGVKRGAIGENVYRKEANMSFGVPDQTWGDTWSKLAFVFSELKCQNSYKTQLLKIVKYLATWTILFKMGLPCSDWLVWVAWSGSAPSRPASIFKSATKTVFIGSEIKLYHSCQINLNFLITVFKMFNLNYFISNSLKSTASVGITEWLANVALRDAYTNNTITPTQLFQLLCCIYL